MSLIGPITWWYTAEYPSGEIVLCTRDRKIADGVLALLEAGGEDGLVPRLGVYDACQCSREPE